MNHRKLSEVIVEHEPSSPEGVTNRPRDLRLLGMSNAIRRAPTDTRPTWMLIYGVLLGILLCMALALWREVERAASERAGPTPAAKSTGAADASALTAAEVMR